MTQDAQTNTTDEWLWTDWSGGECPIPNAKAGEYAVQWETGEIDVFKHIAAGDVIGFKNGSITAYAIRNPHYIAPVETDHAALLKMAVEALEAWERWEADIILHGDWSNEIPRLTHEQYDKMIELQGVRLSTLEAIRKAGVK